MESTPSREYPSSDHALRVLVRIDTQLRLACLEVRGCLTSATYPTLMNILAHTGALGAAVSVSLLRAAHVERDALELLRRTADPAVAGSAPAAEATPVQILAPTTLPVCRAGLSPVADADRSGAPGHALTNEEAAERAFLRRDPRVLAAGSGPVPPGSRRGTRPAGP